MDSAEQALKAYDSLQELKAGDSVLLPNGLTGRIEVIYVQAGMALVKAPDVTWRHYNLTELVRCQPAI